MAAHGGGAWKVAYADFVTAMMAFFLVMWICGQDQTVRKAVSYYFQDPHSTSMVGNTKQPNRTGSVSDVSNLGSVPLSESAALGRGRKSHNKMGEKALATSLVSGWLATDDKTISYWEQQAKQVRKSVAGHKEVQEKRVSLEETAAFELAKLLQDELANTIMGKSTGIQKDLLAEILAQINWVEIAEDLLAR